MRRFCSVFAFPGNIYPYSCLNWPRSRTCTNLNFFMHPALRLQNTALHHHRTPLDGFLIASLRSPSTNWITHAFSPDFRSTTDLDVCAIPFPPCLTFPSRQRLRTSPSICIPPHLHASYIATSIFDLVDYGNGVSRSIRGLWIGPLFFLPWSVVLPLATLFWYPKNTAWSSLTAALSPT